MYDFTKFLAYILTMSEEATTSVNIIRSAQRTVLKDVRNKHKDLILYNKRLGLSEVSEYVNHVTIAEFKDLLMKLRQKNVPLELLKKIKNSCVTPEYIEILFRCEGAYNSLVRILIGSDALKQLEAVACLINLACGSHKCSYKVAKSSGVYLISFVNGSSYFLQELSCWALANIANDCVECFNVIKSQGVLSSLLKALMLPLTNVTQSVLFALNACTKYEDPEVISVIQRGLVDQLLTFMEQREIYKHIFLDAAFTLSNCCFLSVKYSLNIFDIENVEKIINILLSVTQNFESDRLVALPLLRCIGFLSYTDKICQFLSSCSNFYEIIYIIASSENCVHLFKETLWILSNMAVSTDVCKASDLMLSTNFTKNVQKQEKSFILQMLYYFSILHSTNESLHLLQHQIYIEIKSLLECEDKDILESSKTLLKILGQQKQ